MDYRIFNVRTWSFLCVRIHTGVGYTDSETTHFWFRKTVTNLSCAPDTDRVRTLGLSISSQTLYQLSHPVTPMFHLFFSQSFSFFLNLYTHIISIIPEDHGYKIMYCHLSIKSMCMYVKKRAIWKQGFERQNFQLYLRGKLWSDPVQTVHACYLHGQRMLTGH